MKKLATTLAALLVAAATMMAQGGPGMGPRMGGPGRGMGAGRGMGGPGMGPGAGMMAGMHSATVAGAPYSGVESTQMQQTLQNGNQISRQEQAKVYRDSQGRVRTERTNTPPGSTTPHTRITIMDPVASVIYELNPDSKTYFKMAVTAPPNPPTAPPKREPAVGDVQTQDLGTQSVNGLAATGTRTTHTIPAGAIGNQQAIQIVREVWTSTALKVPVSIKTTDPRFGTTTFQLTGVVQSEPDAALFQVPSDYTQATRQQGMGGGMGRGPRHN